MCQHRRTYGCHETSLNARKTQYDISSQCLTLAQVPAWAKFAEMIEEIRRSIICAAIWMDRPLQRGQFNHKNHPVLPVPLFRFLLVGGRHVGRIFRQAILPKDQNILTHPLDPYAAYLLEPSQLKTANSLFSSIIKSTAMAFLGPSPVFPPTPPMPPSLPAADSPENHPIIKALHLRAHLEGGYFVETDRDPLKVPNPFASTSHSGSTRNASTTIFYLLTSSSPKGFFHRNKARVAHTLHRGRGRYVILHLVDEDQGRGQKARIETFVVGQNIDKGERLQWIVEGGTYKASFLLPDEEGTSESG